MRCWPHAPDCAEESGGCSDSLAGRHRYGGDRVFPGSRDLLSGLEQSRGEPSSGPWGNVPAGPYPRVNSVFLNANMLCNYLTVGAALAWYRGYRLFLVGIVTASLLASLPVWGGWHWFWTLRSPVPGSDRGRPCVGRSQPGCDPDFTSGSAGGQSGTLGSPPVVERSNRGLGRSSLTGVGPGANSIRVRYRVPSGMTKYSTDAHNVWLSVASQMGILGLAALLGLILYSLRRAPSRPPGLRDALRVALVGTWVIQGLSGSFEDSRHLWVLLGMLAATEDHDKGDSAPCDLPPDAAGSLSFTVFESRTSCSSCLFYCSTPVHKYGNVCRWVLRGEVAKRGFMNVSTSCWRQPGDRSGRSLPGECWSVATASDPGKCWCGFPCELRLRRPYQTSAGRCRPAYPAPWSDGCRRRDGSWPRWCRHQS